MIKSIHLKNFQSHKDTHIEFSRGVNVIVGPSRNGKTCLLRAIRWVAENRPSGDEFRSHWAGKENTEVELELDGHKIGRIKGNSVNSYSLDKETFNGFGQDVPKPVSDALNLSPINLQQQFDVPFLLFDSPGQVARTLNQVVHLEKIDTALANAASLKRQNDQDVRVQEARLAELEALEASFPDLDAAEEFIAELEEQEKLQSSKASALATLSHLQVNLAGLRYNLAIVEIPAGVEERFGNLEHRLIKKEQLEYTKDLLGQIQGKLRKLRSALSLSAKILGRESLVAELAGKARLMADKKTRLGTLSVINRQIAQARERLFRENAIIKQDEERFKKLMPKVCPLCERVILKKATKEDY